MHQHPAVGSTTTVAIGGKETFTCEHKLVSADKPEYTNVATIEGGGKEKPSNKVVVEVEEPNFSIEKLQRISGLLHEGTAERGNRERVQYEIIVKNTGNTNLRSSVLSRTRNARGSTRPGKRP